MKNKKDIVIIFVIRIDLKKEYDQKKKTEE